VPEDWLGKAPVIPESEIAEEATVDVVVLGGGHAGTQAALGAAQKGATVAVVERQSKAHYMYYGDDICSYNSKFMINRGFGPYDTGEIVSEFCRRSVGRVSPAILRLFVENSGEMFDNMVSLVPSTSNILDIEGGQAIIQVAYGKNKGTDYPVEVSGYKAWATTFQTIGTTNPTPVDGRMGMSRLTEFQTYVRLEAERLGASWYWEHSAAALVQKNGEVTGAIAKRPDGKYLRLIAKKGVLLASGDFAANPDMVYNLLDDVNEWGARIGQDRKMMAGMGRDGIGHKLGCWAGGAIEPHPRPSMNTMGGTPGPWGTSPFLLLNNNGKRFVNEAMAQITSSVCLRQPLGLIAAVTDANFMETVRRSGLDHGAPNWGYPASLARMEAAMAQVKPGPEGANVPQVAIINVNMFPTAGGAPEGAAAPGPFGGSGPNVWAANTLRELLGYLGYKGAALEEALSQIERYNKLCAKAHDDDFGKDANLMLPINKAPFYGSVSQNTGAVSAGLVTLTGLITDENFNVMKADRSGVIKGLYATGNCLGQRYGVGYSTPSAGNSMGMAMTHGRVAGQIMASL
jgi:hypothetical protein